MVTITVSTNTDLQLDTVQWRKLEKLIKVHKNPVKTAYILNVGLIGNLDLIILLFIHTQKNLIFFWQKNKINDEIIILGNACLIQLWLCN